MLQRVRRQHVVSHFYLKGLAKRLQPGLSTAENAELAKAKKCIAELQSEHIPTRRAPRWAIAVSALASALVVLSGCGLGATETSTAETTSVAPTTPPAESPSTTPTAPPSRAATEATEPTQVPEPSDTAEHTVAKLLATLKVKGRAPMTGYDRDRFGQTWLDADRNGCDTHNDVLGEYLTDSVFNPGTRDCVVNSGTLDDHRAQTVKAS